MAIKKTGVKKTGSFSFTKPGKASKARTFIDHEIGFLSKRFFNIAWIENKTPTTVVEASIYELFDVSDSGYEYAFAVRDNADAVLDLKVGERLLMNFNRTNPDSAGHIIRIK